MPRPWRPRIVCRGATATGGAGFLFVATEGGRPPRARRRAGIASVVRRRRRALRRLEVGEPTSAICAEVGCSRASLYRWRERYRAGVSLDSRTPRGGAGPARCRPVIERLVITVRLLTYWNSRRLAAEFGRRGYWPLHHGQVDRILDRAGTHRPSVRRQPGPRYEAQRAQRAVAHRPQGAVLLRRHPPPRQLSLRRAGRRPLPLPARHPRPAEPRGAAHPRPARRGGRAVRRAARADERQRHPLRGHRTQHAVPLPAQPRGAGHPPHPDPDRTPWTNGGKIEAFWRTLQAEVLDRQRLEDLMAAEAAVQAYAGYYNLHRLHGSLGWRTPAERFDGTPFLDRDLDHIPLLAGAAPVPQRADPGPA